jgi:hypothetical protein
MPRGSRYAVISGDPSRSVPFMMRVEMPPGYLVPPYSRSADENLIVLSGALMIGNGNRFNRTSMRTLHQGSFEILRANEPHFTMTTEGAIVQIFGVGPFAISYVSPQ